MKWLLLLLPFWLQGQSLKPGIYYSLQTNQPLVLDTGCYTFVGLEMQPPTSPEGGLSNGIWLDARKARSLTLLHCTFEGNGSGTAVLSSGDLVISQCAFEKFEEGIVQQSPKGSHRKVAVLSNVFKDNGVAIRLAVERKVTGNVLVSSNQNLPYLFHHGTKVGAEATNELTYTGNQVTGFHFGLNLNQQSGTAKATVNGNTFTDNRTAIHLEREGESGTATVNFTLKCNEFINTPQTTTSFTRKGLVIGEGVLVRAPNDGAFINDQIGGSNSFDVNNPNIAYPNANVWPTPDFDEVIPNSGLPNFIPLDVNDVWGNSPNWISIQNASSNAVTYHRFFNEFVGKSIALVNTELAPVTYTDESVVTQANSNINPNLTTVPACSLLVDPTPVLFPSRIAVVGLDSTTTSVIHSKMGKGLEISDPIPNPASGKVLILASIPFKFEQATLQILQSGTGKVLQNIELAKGAKLEITLDVEKSPTGAYQYRLIVDGKASKPKALIVTH